MDNKPVKIMHYVNTGELRVCGIEACLNSGAIGSCVVVVAFDAEKKSGAMAHIMLPGTSPETNKLKVTKYAANALEELFGLLKSLEAKTEKLEVCIAGGANVLRRKNDNIGTDNLNSVKKLLKEYKVEIKAETIGGFERRTVIYDIEMGCIYYTVGDSKQKVLWQTNSK